MTSAPSFRYLDELIRWPGAEQDLLEVAFGDPVVYKKQKAKILLNK